MVLARASSACFEVVLEVRVAGPDLDDALERARRQRGAAEIGVHQHAGRVQDTAEARSSHPAELLEHRVDERAGLTARTELVSRARQDVTSSRDGELVRLSREPLVGKEPIDGRKVAR